MKFLLNYFLKTAVPAFAMSAAVLFSINAFSCSSGVDGLQSVSGEFTYPSVTDIRQLSENRMVLTFSRPVTRMEVSLDDGMNRTKASCILEDEGLAASITFAEATETGREYSLEGEVMDEKGSSLSFSFPFKGFNRNPARLIISEVRNAYAAVTIDKKKVHKSEFVEVYVLQGGNLSGLELMSAADGKEKCYEFPPVEVTGGEYITVHLRRPVSSESCPSDGEGIADETGTNLSLSTHVDSNPQARDLWSENTKSCLGDSDIIVIRNTWTGYIDDCIVYAKSGLESWPASFAETVREVNESGAWIYGGYADPCVVESAFCSDSITGTAATRSISRQNTDKLQEYWDKAGSVPPSKAADFMVTVDSGSGKNKIYGVTPGAANSDNEYVQKN